MRLLLRLCTCLACWFVLTGWAAPAAIALSAVADASSLGLRAEVLEDKTRALGIADILAAPDLPWRANGTEVLNFSFSHSAYWVHLRLHNDTAAPLTRLLETASALQDVVDLHVVHRGQITETVATGDRRPFANRPLPYRYPVFPLAVAPGQTLDLYLRLDTHDGLFEAMPLVLRTPQGFLRHSQTESVAFGAYYGAIVALLLYNLLLFALVRDGLFLKYVLYLAAYLTWNLCFTGIGFHYLWPGAPDLNNQMLAVAVPLIFVALTAFSASYLQTRTRAPRLHRTMVGLVVLCTLQPITGLLDFYAATFITILPIGAAMLVVQMIAAVRIAVAGYRPARFYVLASSALALGALVTFLKVFDLVPSSPLVEYSLNIGSALEFILLALALADKMNQLKAEKLAAEQQALAVQTALAQDLDRKVHERTQALELANAQLQTAAITDALTGIYNRRYFDTLLRREFNRCMRQQASLALCVIDIDNFKKYNDRFGHQQGDEALKAVAQALAQRVQRSTDHLFRVGGEEFVVLMAGQTRASAMGHLEILRLAVQALAMPHPDNPAQVVTVSCGMAWSEVMQGEPDALYAQADQALYRAKQAGRNQSAQ